MMETLAVGAVLALTMFVPAAFAPTATATSWAPPDPCGIRSCDPCYNCPEPCYDCIDPCGSGSACDKLGQILSREYWVRDNGDGTYSVGYTYCTNYGCYDSTIVTTPAAPGTCFAHNPDALTNACVTTGTESTNVWAPMPYTYTQKVCYLGYNCVYVPLAGVTWVWVPATTPTVDGYVEATALCTAWTLPCRVDL